MFTFGVFTCYLYYFFLWLSLKAIILDAGHYSFGIFILVFVSSLKPRLFVVSSPELKLMVSYCDLCLYVVRNFFH